MKLRLAVVGAGSGRGQSWLATIKKLTGHYELCALCEVDERRAQENARRWETRAYTDLMTLLAEQGPDVVLCAIPPDGNHMVTCLAAEHGAHVIVEIPVAPTRPIAEFMMEVTQRHGVKLEVAENVYRWASERLKRKIIEAGLIGEVVHVRLWYLSGSYHGFNAVRTLLESEANRVLGYAGTVPVPDRLASGYLMRDIPESAWESAIVEFENGIVCLYEMPPSGLRGNLWEIEGTEGQLVGNELYLGVGGERQRLPFRFEYATVNGERVLDHVRVDTEPPVVFENPFKRYGVADDDEVARAQILIGFHRSVTEDLNPEYGAENAWRDQELCVAVRESALRGSIWVELPLSELTEVERGMHEAYHKLYGCDALDIKGMSKVAFPRGGVRWEVAQWL
jgi:predicted dehydrogenase